ncbi:Proteasome-associated protein ECM29-like protein [Smittium mucronatum]|uniref:Proteasome-associated protein ECM29-like protein n=1 Tax=Smittium mucronatum TaxID=133383 RepID=A0A1R0H8P0_9FUNG|nr:Proteasome-associated protein ECM29-like protein [Smittium mucronatum]
MSEEHDLELLETIGFRFGLADSSSKVDTHVNNFLVPLLYKLNSGTSPVLELLNHIGSLLKNDKTVSLPTSEIFDFYMDPTISSLSKNIGLLYIQKSMERCKIEELPIYLSRLINGIDLVPETHKPSIVPIILQGLGDVGSQGEVYLNKIKLESTNSSKYVLNLSRDLFMFSSTPTSSEKGPIYPGLSPQIVSILTNEKKAIWTNGGNSLSKFKKGVFDFVNKSSLFDGLHCENERFISLLCASCDPVNYEVTTSASDSLKKINVLDYEDKNLIVQLSFLFLGGKSDDIFPNMNRAPCSSKLKSLIMKHLSKSIVATSMFPDWLKILFDCLFGEFTTQQLKILGAMFMRYVCQKSPIEQLRIAGPVLFQGIKKLLNILEDQNVSNTRNQEVIRMNAYNSWTILITRLPALFNSDIDGLKNLISTAEKEPPNIRSNAQETIYEMGISIFKKFCDDILITDNVLDILEETILNSSSTQIKLTVLRILSDGPDFSNCRSKCIAMIGYCDPDPQVSTNSLNCLNMDPGSLKIAFNSSDNAENSQALELYFSKLPEIYSWLSALLNFLLTGKSTGGYTNNNTLSNLKTLDSILTNFNNPDFNYSVHPKSFEPLMLFTIQLLILHGLFFSLKNFNFIIEASSIEKEWVDEKLELSDKEAEKIIFNFGKANSFDHNLLDNTSIRMSVYLSLRNLYINENANHTIELLPRISLFSLLTIQKFKDISNTSSVSESLERGVELSSILFKLTTTLGPPEVHDFVLKNFKLLSYLLNILSSETSQIFLSEGLASSLTTTWDLELNDRKGFATPSALPLQISVITLEIFEAVEILSDQISKNMLKSSSSSPLSKKNVKRTIGCLLTSSYSITRINSLFTLRGYNYCLDKYPDVSISLDKSINLLKLTLKNLLEIFYSIKVKKITPVSEDLSPFFSTICVCVRELGIFGNLNSFPPHLKEFENPSYEILVEELTSFYIIELIKSGRCNFSEVKSLVLSLSGIAIKNTSKLIESPNGSTQKEYLSVFILKLLRDLSSSEKNVLKTFDTQFLISEIVPLISSKWNILHSKSLYNGSLYLPFSDFGILGLVDHDCEKSCWDWIIFEALLPMSESHRVTERFAAATWAGSLALECSNLKLMSDHCVFLHKIMCGLLLDSDEMVQSVAGKSISLIYESSDSSKNKDLMLHSLINTLGNRRMLLLSNPDVNDVSTGLRNQLIPNSQSVDTNESSSNSRGRNNNVFGQRPSTKSIISLTYYQILDLASEVGNPELFYHMVVLAGHSIQTSINYGLSSYSVKSINNAIETSNRYSKKLIPSLFFLCFSVNPAISKSMNSIWHNLYKTNSPNSAFSVTNENFTYPSSSPILIKNWDSIYKKSIVNMGSSDWKVRQSSCSAMIFALSFSGNLPVNIDFIETTWKLSLRLLDDIKDSVRLEALTFCNSLSSATIIWAEESLTTPESQNINGSKTHVENSVNSINITDSKVSDSIISTVIKLMVDVGLASPAEDVRKFSLSFINKLSHLNAIKPYSGKLAIKYLESLSDMEDQTFNYISQNANNWEISSQELDSFRLSSTKSSPVMVTLERFLGYLTEDQMAEFIPELCRIITHGMGLPTRTGTARAIVNISVNHPDLIKNHALTIARSILSVIKNSSSVEMYAWASAIAYISPFLELKSFEKLSNILFKLYFSKDNEGSKISAIITLSQISKRSLDKVKNASKISSLFYFGSFDENPDVSRPSKDSWSLVTDGLTPTDIKQIYSESIISLCNEKILSDDWTFIKQSAFTLSNLCSLSPFGDNFSSYKIEKFMQADITSLISSNQDLESDKYSKLVSKLNKTDIKFIGNLNSTIGNLMKVTKRKNWLGRDSCIHSMTSVSIACQPAILKNPLFEFIGEEIDLSQSILDVSNNFIFFMNTNFITYFSLNSRSIILKE